MSEETPISATATPAPVDDVVDRDEEASLPRVETLTEVKAILEALLFTTNQSLSVRRLTAMLPGWSEHHVLETLLELQAEYDDAGRGVMVQEIAGGWTMATRPRWAEWVFSLHRARRRNPLTPQALETLAIIAYKQPITRADIEVIRGVDSGGMLRNLLDLDLVHVAGHRESIGRPPLYGTTPLFLRTFGLRTLSDLPTVEELVRLMPKNDVIVSTTATRPQEGPAMDTSDLTEDLGKKPREEADEEDTEYELEDDEEIDDDEEDEDIDDDEDDEDLDEGDEDLEDDLDEDDEDLEDDELEELDDDDEELDENEEEDEEG